MLALDRPEIQHGVHESLINQRVWVWVVVEFIGYVDEYEHRLVIEAQKLVQVLAIGGKTLLGSRFTH